MEYIKVARVSDLPANQMIKVDAAGKDVLLANVDGTYYAIPNKCTHLGGSLADGSLEGSVVTCPRHGAKFDLITGKNVGDAKLGFIKVKPKDELAYPVKVEGDEILVGLP